VPKVKLTNRPDQTVEVSDREMTDLQRMGLVLEEVTDEEQTDEQPEQQPAPEQTAAQRPKAQVTKDKAFPSSDEKTK